MGDVPDNIVLIRITLMLHDQCCGDCISRNLQCSSTQQTPPPLACFSLSDIAVAEQAASAQVHIVAMIQTVEATVAGYGYLSTRASRHHPAMG